LGNSWTKIRENTIKKPAEWFGGDGNLFFWKVACGLFRVGFGGFWGFAGLGCGIFSVGWKFHAGRMKMNLGSNFFGAGFWGFFWAGFWGRVWGPEWVFVEFAVLRLRFF
jgi:hypothetical protein